MVTLRFKSYPAFAKVKFRCKVCNKPNRSKTIRHECTVNPFNRGDDGLPLGPDDVRKQSREKVDAERKAFLSYPVCAKCANDMPYEERESIRLRRETTT